MLAEACQREECLIAPQAHQDFNTSSAFAAIALKSDPWRHDRARIVS
jgi:hypothetical protein